MSSDQESDGDDQPFQRQKAIGQDEINTLLGKKGEEATNDGAKDKTYLDDPNRPLTDHEKWDL